MRTARTTLEYLMGSKVRAHVLRRLLSPRCEPAWFRAVAAGSGSVSGVRREIERFMQLGLIRSRFAAGGRFLDANETHPLFEALRDLVMAADEFDPPASGWVEPDPLWDRLRRPAG
jgi:hypothetical protein